MNGYREHEYTLASLIESERLILQEKARDLDVVIEEILPEELETPLIIGIDGSVTAGKSFLASRMERYFGRRGLDCAVIHGDWYMSSRARRMQEVEAAQKGPYDIALFDQAVCDYAALAKIQARINEFFRSGRPTYDVNLAGCYNRDTGLLDGTVHLVITDQTVVVFEGTGILNASMKPGFDLAVRVDIGTYDETIRRLYAREAEKEASRRISEKLVKQRYDLIDYRYDGYLRSRDRYFFDVLLDTSDPALMAIYARA